MDNCGKSQVRHVKVSTKAMQLQLSALALETCKQAAARYHEVNQKLQERPLSLEPLVEYVRHFKPEPYFGGVWVD